ncbi:MAG: hypothetical protein ACI36W_00500 [Coriobacteriales bacterium]
MKITSSYGVRIPRADKAKPDGLTKAQADVLADTVRVYRGALAFCTEVASQNWEALEPLRDKERRTCCERMVHATKDNPVPAYPEFDVRFYKMPSYLRRAAIAEALGAVSSHISNLERWEAGDRKGKRPKLGIDRFAFPTFYKGGMRREVDVERCTVHIKVYAQSDWVWMELPLKKGDLAYIARRFEPGQVSNPTLERRGKVWSLRFACTLDSELTDTAPHEGRVLGVDLGLNTCATCCVMEPDGTVAGRVFIDFPAEKDRLIHARNRVKKAQQAYSGHGICGGGARTPRLWARVDGINKDLASKVASAVVDAAALYSCDYIVFENLSGCRGGKRNLSLWRKQEIQRVAAHRAHVLGMRVRTVCAWNTSKLAFDGSGRVYRGRRGLEQAVADGVIGKQRAAKLGHVNAQTCVLPSGKVYNCDLNASYNIAARFLVREILKSLPETARLGMQAEVPACSKGTTATLSTLIDLRAALQDLTGLKAAEPGRICGEGARAA